MPIVIQHQPVQALGALATSAGQAMAENDRQEQRDRLQLQDINQKHEQAKLEFLQESQEAARAEEMQYQMQLNMQRRDIDMQVDLQNYSRQKQELQQTLNLIRTADTLNDSEKEQFEIQATARFAGVGTGIDSGSFAGNAAMKQLQNQIVMGNYKASQYNEIQKEFAAGNISELQASNKAALYNLGPVKFVSSKEQANQIVDTKVKRLTTARDSYNKSFFTDKKGRVFDAITEEPVKEGTPKYELWDTMRDEMRAAQDEVGDLRGELDYYGMVGDFEAQLAWDTELIGTVQEVGKEKALAIYIENQPKSKNYKPPEDKNMFQKMRNHPIMDTVARFQPGGAGNLYFGATRGYDLAKKGINQVVDPESDLNKKVKDMQLW